jgi:predicted nucleic acid-binding protein
MAPNIVIDSNVMIAALRSRKGTSNKLLFWAGIKKFEIHDSVALIREYEEVLQQQ